MSFEPVTTFTAERQRKTTALNAIADAVGAQRSAPYNRTSFWQQYVSHCHARGAWQRAENVAILTSDDVFDYMLDVRSLNDGIDAKRETVFEEYMSAKIRPFSNAFPGRLRPAETDERRQTTQPVPLHPGTSWTMYLFPLAQRGERFPGTLPKRSGENGLYPCWTSRKGQPFPPPPLAVCTGSGGVFRGSSFFRLSFTPYHPPFFDRSYYTSVILHQIGPHSNMDPTRRTS